MNDNKYLSVSALNKYLYYKFDNDLNLRTIYLKAEISNIRYSKGILYFVLKDSESEISGLMYGATYEKLNFKLEDGMTVLVTGKVGLYAKRGTYAITVYKMETLGLGEAYLKFLMLKDKLMKEGLFNDDLKKPIKKINHKIGLITSSTGDAMHDVISTVNKRYPLAEVILYPALVQGEDAPLSLINALDKAINDASCDVLIIARGGGSLEDLSCFNDEGLARKIFSSPIPIISGVGHEADFTICDFVSDRRAPTPTGAAVIATPDSSELYKYINSFVNTLNNYIKNKLNNAYNAYSLLANAYVLKNFNKSIDIINTKLDVLNKRLLATSPVTKLNTFFTNVENDKNNLIKAYKKKIDNLVYSYTNDVNKLILLNPLNIMAKGYSITLQNDTVITNINDIKTDLPLHTKILGGEIISTINKIRREKEDE